MNVRPGIDVRSLLVVYCLSGLVSLGYQIVWFRIYADRFGSSSLTFLLVLTNFIAGLGFGAIASERVAGWLARRLKLSSDVRTYGAVELIIAALVSFTVFSSLVPDDLWGNFPYVLDRGVFVPTLGYQLGQLILATACVFTPAFFMGVTFPLLCQAMSGRRRFPSRLYAWNTLGACAGVLVCQFLLIHLLGHNWTLLGLIGLNVLIGMYCVCARGPCVAHASAATAQPSVVNACNELSVPSLVALGALSGLLTGALEGDLFKRLWFLGTNSGAAMAFVSFWAILAIFLASATVTRARWLKLVHIKLAFAAAFLVYLGTWSLAYPIRGWFQNQYTERLGESFDISSATASVVPRLQTDLLFSFVFVGLFSFPAVFLLALMLPFVCNAANHDQGVLGRVYGVNTLAFCLGMFGFVWLAPRVDIFYSLKLAMVLLATGAIAVWFFGERSRRPMLSAALAVVLFTFGALTTPSGFDRSALDPGRRAYQFPVRALKSNGAHTTYILEVAGDDVLYFDSHPMSGAAIEAQIYMRLMAHFPLLAQAQPKAALLIGFGVGNTASAIAQHSTIERLDIVDLNRKVIETAPEFAATNGAVYDDPRVRFINDDGRRFLELTDQRYDLITSEPPPPMQDGVYRLYSTEYYQAALERLTPTGMLTQWLPISQLSRTATELMVSSFRTVFPETLLFSGYGAQLILVGSRAPIDLARIERRLDEETQIAADLRRLRMPSVEHLMARVMSSDDALDRRYADSPTISDERNDLAYQVSAPLNLSRVSIDPMDTRRMFEQAGLNVYPALAPVLIHLGRLLYRVPDFPVNWLDIQTSSSSSPINLADAPWGEISRTFDDYRFALASRDLEAAQTLLQHCLALAEQQPLMLLELVYVQLQLEAYAQAVETASRFIALEPAEAVGHVNLAFASLGEGDIQRARDAAELALEIAPTLPAAYRARAKVRFALGERLLALDDYDRALELSPDDITLIRERMEVSESFPRAQGT